MADLTVTASKVATPYAIEARKRNYTANAAITAGQPVYGVTTGKVDLADANASGKEQFIGIALEPAAAGETLSVLERGEVEGFDLSGLSYFAPVYLSDTAGALATAASGTKTVVVGQVRPHNTVGGFKKTLYISADPSRIW